ncbi:unnamed protein product [Rotaria sp. Silwood1]|nr:unnamed protein product [Rotaria sp. Silwood1]
MDTHDDNNEVRDKFQQQLILKKLELQLQLEEHRISEETKFEIEKHKISEKTKREIEKHKIIEETKFEIEKQKLIQQLQLHKKNAQEEIQQYKLELEFGSSSIKRSGILLWFHDDFYKYYVSGHLYSFSAIDLFKNDNDLNDNILTHIQCYLHECSSNSQLNEIFIQQAFNKMMVKLLKEINCNTILKYLSTSSQGYLQEQFRPACTFIYKNVNINMNEQHHFLEDFVVFLGDLKTPDVSLTDTSAIGQVLQYLKVLLDVQKRRKIYGFLCNYKEIKFFYIENKDNNYCYKYYESEQLKLFSNLSETSFIGDKSRKTIKHSRNLCINKDTWKVFIRFLTMNCDFYEYTHLDIDPYDNLLCNEYMITKRLGYGFTSKVYLLKQIKCEHQTENLKKYVMKISKNSSYKQYFLNEFQIIQKLKQSNNLDKFNLYFQDILSTLSSSDKYLVYEKELQCIKSLSLEQSKQVIDVLHYLYKSRIIHRDIRPENIMLDNYNKHIKLIDFAFAIAYDLDGKAGSIEIIGTTIYASCKFLDFISKLLIGIYLPYYEYERSYDLTCALNIIMSMTNVDIKRKISSIEIIPNIQEKQLKILQLWQNTQRKNKHYSNLLNLIKKLDESYESSTFDVLKDKIEQLFDK